LLLRFILELPRLAVGFLGFRARSFRGFVRQPLRLC
jgi:hypothetical protein